ncbi:PD-(D/E)XK nuclease superfamily protein [Ruminococcaceae bacterium FB2012]|nr:PD-(D/E)XK nuclease superfamily protein [Ruminococcaceae bacterium FB2012]
MGKYYNPGNKAFAKIVNDKYVDKSGLISCVNDTIDKANNLTCISRPRRFGKSFAAKMLCAYYDCSCDSRSLFEGLEISRSADFDKHLNKYNVIAFDVTGFISAVKESGESIKKVPSMIVNALRNDLVSAFPQLESIPALNDCLLECVKITGREFVFIIDEWDALIREAKNDNEVQTAYLNFLRGLFKNNDVTPYVIAAAYMTGILPIKKDGSQSAISDFREYTVLSPGPYASYFGFTEAEVEQLCKQYSMDFSTAKTWYDGYRFGSSSSVYNPYSVMLAVSYKEFRSFWRQTSAADALKDYVEMDFDGLQETVARLIAGESVSVDTNGFKNDFESFGSKDDVITLLIHLGYLSYDRDDNTVSIPNSEVRQEFEWLLKRSEHTKLNELIRTSEQLLSDTLTENSDAVAEAIDRIRQSQYAPQFYNNEQALRAVIKYAYIVCVDKYMKLEELPSGKGVADVVFIPKKTTPYPAMIVELKWNRSSETAINQIRDKNYPAVLSNYFGDILLVGISYDEKSKKHSCGIYKINK